MLGRTTTVLCMLVTVLPVASHAGPEVKHALCGGSGVCVSHSAGKNLVGILGRCVGAHVLQRAPCTDKDSNPGRFENAASSSGAATWVGLGSSYPNPLNPEASIEYSVKAVSHVALGIYDVRGELVRAIVDEKVASGAHVAHWDGTNARGARVTSGIYFVRLETEWGIFSRKLIVAR